MTVAILQTKQCLRCEKPLPLSEFHRNRAKKDGLDIYCCGCIRQRDKRYQVANSDKIRQYQKEYRQTSHGREVRKRYRNTLKGYLKQVFADMNKRCNNPNRRAFKDYGGRGIQNRFKSLDDFRNYVTSVLKIDPRGLQIDRINNDGHYEKGNVRFVTAKENSNNRRERTK